MRYLHTMIRVGNIERSVKFYKEALGFRVVRQEDHDEGKFTLVFLQSTAGEDRFAPQIELTYNWGVDSYEMGTAYGHVAYHVQNMDEAVKKIEAAGFKLSYGPGRSPDGKKAMAFVQDPDGYKIELLEG
ncbi:MAG: lactoylglutathione lyase [Proteobacteria bacterium]|nr:MAG: lactoylglutathione lyase [Pseudomonadota bacterium]